jgi:small-conductance mechanosensitive channel
LTRILRGLLIFLVFLGVMRVLGVRLDNFFDFVRAVLSFRLFTLGETDVSLLTILVMVAVVWVAVKIARVVRRYFQNSVFNRFNLEYGVRASLSKLIAYVIIAIGIVIALQGLGIKLSALTVFAGVLGVGIGFGMQSITANMVSGIVILFERPIKEGDMVRLGTTVGTVRKINLRATVIQTIYNEHLIVPNSEFINETVENMSYEDLKLKISVKVGVAYSSDPRAVREALIEAARRTENVMESMEPYVLFRDFGDSSLDFELFAWIDGPLKRYQIESEMRYNVFQIFREREITIPFPQRDLWVKQVPGESSRRGFRPAPPANQ